LKSQVGATALHHAARTGRHDLITFLVNSGANLDAADNVLLLIYLELWGFIYSVFVGNDSFDGSLFEK
jgi:ankyrin repeat protein